MKKIFIVGGDGFARECLNILKEVEGYGSEILFEGFLGHRGYGEQTNYKNFAQFYVGDVSEHIFADEEYCIIGAGFPELRKKIYKDLKDIGVHFYNLIGRGCFIPKSVTLGEGNIFIPPFRGSVNINIGNGNVFNCDVIVGHDVEIGNFNFCGPRSIILGNVKIGSMNIIGSSSILMANCRVGDHNKIAPLSCVYKGCRDGKYMLGNPAVNVGENDNCYNCSINV